MSTECPAPTRASAPAGTSAIRFSFVLISFGTPIFMDSKFDGVVVRVCDCNIIGTADDGRRTTGDRRALTCPPTSCQPVIPRRFALPSASFLRAETQNGHPLRRKVLTRDRSDLQWGNGVD